MFDRHLPCGTNLNARCIRVGADKYRRQAVKMVAKGGEVFHRTKNLVGVNQVCHRSVDILVSRIDIVH